jgi:hypothetical protein
MKNTLAENMLRFGVKNLHKSDVKKISQLQEQQAQPIQPYAAINPRSWTFKDRASLDSAFDSRMYAVGKIDPNAAGQGVYGPWAQEYSKQANVTKKMNPNAQVTAQALAADLALLMAVKGNYKVFSVTNFAQVLKDSQTYSNKMYNANNNFHTPAQIIGNKAYGISTEVNPRGQAMNQKQWEATLQLIGPAIEAVITKFVVPMAPVAAPKPSINPQTPGAAKPGM